MDQFGKIDGRDLDRRVAPGQVERGESRVVHRRRDGMGDRVSEQRHALHATSAPSPARTRPNPGYDSSMHSAPWIVVVPSAIKPATLKALANHWSPCDST